MPVSHEEWGWDANEKRCYFGENKKNSCEIKRISWEQMSIVCTQNVYIHICAYL